MAVQLPKNNTVKYVVLAIVGLIVLYFLAPIIAFFKMVFAKLAGKMGDVVVDTELSALKKKYNHPYFDNIANNIVPSIHSAYNVDGMDENEDVAIENLNKLKTVTQAQIASDVYKVRYMRSLKDDSERYLTDGADIFGLNIRRVNQTLRNNWF